MVEILPKPIVPDRLATALGRHCTAAGVALSVAGTLADLGVERTQGLVALMLERMEVEVPALLAALAEGRTSERARIAHQLKGAVGNFDMPDLVALLAAVETAETGAEAGLSLALNRARAELRRSLAALQHEEWVGWDRTMVEDLFAGSGVSAPERIVVSRSMEITRALVGRGDLISVFARPALDRELARHGIRAIPVQTRLPELTISAITRKGALPTPAAGKFLAAVRLAARSLQH